MTINIWNPTDYPFGPLSNNFNFEMEIDGVNFRTVSNFIYSNLLPRPDYKKILSDIFPEHVIGMYSKLDVEHTRYVATEAYNTATKIKFETNPSLFALLKATSTQTIVFRDHIPIFDGPSNSTNMIGSSLMTIRHSLLSGDSKEGKVQIYKAYVAMTMLEHTSRDEASDLHEFEDLSISEIINKHIMKYATRQHKLSGETNDLAMLSQEDINNKYQRLAYDYYQIPEIQVLNALESLIYAPADSSNNILNNFQLLSLLEVSIYNPQLLVMYVQKKNIDTIHERQLVRLKTIIFTEYVHDLLEKNYPNLKHQEYDYVIKNELSDTVERANYLKDEIYEMYIEGMLSPKLYQKIIIKIGDFKFQSEENVERIRSANLHGLISMYMTEHTNKIILLTVNNEDMTDPVLYPLSPFDISGKLEIQDLVYPSVMHYVYSRLFLSLYMQYKGGDNIDPYGFIVANVSGSGPTFIDIDKLQQRYYSDKKYFETTKILALARMALNKKFQNPALKDLLAYTAGSTLFWVDPNDHLLSDKIGLMLQDIRSTLTTQSINTKQMTATQVEDLIQGDSVLHQWVVMRVTDVCNVVSELRLYAWGRFRKTLELDNELVDAVLETIYGSCSAILGVESFTSTTPPEFVAKITRNAVVSGTSVSPESVDKSVVQSVWDYVSKVIWFITRTVDRPRQIQEVLKKSQTIVSSTKQCNPPSVYGLPYDDCILASLINLLLKLEEFNKCYGLVTKPIRLPDVQASVNILLNRKYNETLPVQTQRRDPRPPTPPVFDVIIKKTPAPTKNFVFAGEDDQEYMAYAGGDFDNMIIDDDLPDLPHIEGVGINEDEDNDFHSDYDFNSVAGSPPQGDDDGGGFFSKSGSPTRVSAVTEIMSIPIKRATKNALNENRKALRYYRMVEPIHAHLIEVGLETSDSSEDLSRLLVGAVYDVKKFNMALSLKTNRINFFAF